MGWIALFGFLFGVMLFGMAAKGRAWSQTVVGGGSLAAGLAMMGLALSLAGPAKPPPVPLTPAEQRAARVLAQFSQWSGAHLALEAHIKKNLNDPASYEHIETRYQDRGEHVFVRTKFRGANLFGGRVINEVVATADVDGRLLTVEMVKP